MKKVGIIRCQQTEDLCPGTTDFVTAAKGKGSFEAFGECQIVGCVSCGGCPGKRAVARAKMLVDRGAEAVALASCIGKGSPIGFPCPNRERWCRPSVRRLATSRCSNIPTKRKGTSQGGPPTGPDIRLSSRQGRAPCCQRRRNGLKP